MINFDEGMRHAAKLLVLQRDVWLADALLLPDNAFALRHQAATANALANLVVIEANKIAQQPPQGAA